MVLTSWTATAQLQPPSPQIDVNVPMPAFENDRPTGEFVSCQQAAVSSFEKCTAAVSAYNTAKVPTPADVVGGEAALMAMKQNAADDAVNLNKVAGACNAANTECQTVCSKAYTAEIAAAQKAAGQLKNRVAHNQLAIHAAGQDGKQGGFIGSCKTALTGAAGAAASQASAQTASAGQFARAEGQAKATGAGAPGKDGDSWFSRNSDWMIPVGVGAAAGLGGYFLGKSNGKDEQQEADQKAWAAASASAAAAASTSASSAASTGFVASTTDCTSAGTYTNSACYSSYVSSCMTNQNGNQCQLFANSYCGLGNGTDSGAGITPNGSGPGNGTSYCRATIGWRYCQTSGRSNCPTCVQQGTLTNQVCMNNPVLCIGQYSQAQLTAMQSQCPNDPYYSQTATNAATTTTTTNAVGIKMSGLTTSGAGSARAAAPAYSTGAAFDGSLTAAAAGASAAGADAVVAEANGTRGPASTNGVPGMAQVPAHLPVYNGVQSEVTASLGRNLFEKSQLATHTWCDAVMCQATR